MYPDAIYVGNFKAFGQEQKIPIRPITLIYGPNSAGKSSILHALAMLSKFCQTGVTNTKEITLTGNTIHIGDFEDYLHANSNDQKITFGWEYTKKDNLILGQKITIGRLQSSKISIKKDYNDDVIVNGKCKIMSWRLEENGKNVFQINYDPKRYKLSIDPKSELIKRSLALAKIELRKALDEYLENDISNSNQKDVISAIKDIIFELDHGNILKDIEKEYRDQVNKCRVSHDSHGLEFQFSLPDTENICKINWGYWNNNRSMEVTLDIDIPVDLRSYIRSQIIKKGAQASVEILEAFIHTCRPRCDFDQTIYFGKFRQSIDLNEIFTSKQLLESKGPHDSVYAKGWCFGETGISLLNEWLGQTKRPDLEFELRLLDFLHDVDDTDLDTKYYTIRLFDKKRKVNVAFDNVGSGIGQIFPVLLAAFNDMHTCIIVEQPELHLHPALQSEIADAFAICALGKPEEPLYNNFVLETHSEHILLRLMRRIRESTNGTLPSHIPKLTPKDIAVLYVEPRGTYSVVRELRLNDQGELIDDWPGGFFEEGLRELLM